jgi:geranylgeranyl diphosphate synthase, type I
MPEPVDGSNQDHRPFHPGRGLLLITANTIIEFDRWIDNEIEAVLESVATKASTISARDLPLYDVLRYHLGILNSSFEPERSDPGKRLRSKLCLLCCDATGADPRLAVPVAAAVELLHNFTLIHDDIQDRSTLRRHRDTVWSLWGVPQAINAGDAMFAVAHLALNRSVQIGVPANVTLDLSTELHQTTLRIVEGQVLDLGFEQRDDVVPDEYLAMINGKTAAIIQFACWAGARVGDALPANLPAFQNFGRALGLGFQIRDDYLGVWGDEATTGKPFADDVRRRKQSLPVLLLKERAAPHERAQIDALYHQDELASDDIDTVLALFEKYEVSDSVQSEVMRWHDRALSLLSDLRVTGDSAATITELIDGLVNRDV